VKMPHGVTSVGVNAARICRRRKDLLSILYLIRGATERKGATPAGFACNPIGELLLVLLLIVVEKRRGDRLIEIDADPRPAPPCFHSSLAETQIQDVD
jgi:hypothetical protein